MRFDINITGADQAAARLRNLSANMDNISLRTLYNELEAIVTWLSSEVKPRTPYRTGVLRSSIFGEVSIRGKAIEGIVSTPLVYGPPVEFGRKPNPSGRGGFAGRRMFQRAWEENLSRITSLLNDMGVHVTEELLRNL